MTHSYTITGMTCGNCVAKVKSQLLMLGDVTEAEVKLDSPQATISMEKHIPLSLLQQAVSKAGNYRIEEAGDHSSQMEETGSSWWQTYKPIFLVGMYLTGVTLIIEGVSGEFQWDNWMRNFMAGFFIVFSFFKLINLKGFAESYAMYDIVARRWAGWGYVYAFAELALGIAFLVDFNPLLTNAVAFVLMSVSIIGVLQSVMNGRKIRCACLGAVFNLPMSTITIVEDALMIAMSGTMILMLL